MMLILWQSEIGHGITCLCKRFSACVGDRLTEHHDLVKLRGNKFAIALGEVVSAKEFMNGYIVTFE